MALINASTDAHATETAALRHRDALGDKTLIPPLQSSYLHHHHTRSSAITSPHRLHTSLLASPTSNADLALRRPCTVAHNSGMGIPNHHVVRHTIPVVNRSPTHIVTEIVDAGGVAPPLTRWSSDVK
jgi:hypothetical protein